jgi:hypothetical protein
MQPVCGSSSSQVTGVTAASVSEGQAPICPPHPHAAIWRREPTARFRGEINEMGPLKFHAAVASSPHTELHVPENTLPSLGRVVAHEIADEGALSANRIALLCAMAW